MIVPSIARRVLNRLRRVLRGTSTAGLNSVTMFDGYLPTEFPVDVVYTWVNGGDPRLREKRSRYDSSPHPHRYTDHQELKYSLRSVSQYLPWVNHIYVVTDEQQPEWLSEHPKLSVVDHTEILDREYLPTFNSHVIESALHRIPGISEHYVYLNDDMVFLRPMLPTDFFTTAGFAYAFISYDALPQDGADQLYSVTAQLNALEMINQRLECSFRQRMKHTYYPQRRSVLHELEREFHTEFQAMRMRRFRTAKDFVTCTTLHAMWAYATGRGLLRSNRTHYISVRSADARRHYRRILAEKGKPDARSTLCLNDAMSPGDREAPHYEDHLRQFCETYFPEPSPFERMNAAS